MDDGQRADLEALLQAYLEPVLEGGLQSGMYWLPLSLGEKLTIRLDEKPSIIVAPVAARIGHKRVYKLITFDPLEIGPTGTK